LSAVHAIVRSVSDWLASPAVISVLFPRRPKSFSWSGAGAILIVKLDEIGDFVLVTPFLRELRRQAPQARITLVVKPAVLNLAETCPYVDRVLVYDGRTEGLRLWQLRRQWRAWRLAWRELQPAHFDVAVLPRWGEDAYNATHLAVYSRARALVAYTEAATDAKRRMNARFDRLLTHVVPADILCHEVTHNLRLLERYGRPWQSDTLELWLTEADRAHAARLLPGDGPFAALAPGALDPVRRWPVDRFEAFATWLHAKHGLTSVIFGSTQDPACAGTIDLRGRTSLREATATLARCRLFVGNDTSLKHLAAAVGLPVVEISGFPLRGNPNHANSPARFGAWGTPHRILQPDVPPGPLAIDLIPLSAAQTAVEALISVPRP